MIGHDHEASQVPQILVVQSESMLTQVRRQFLQTALPFTGAKCEEVDGPGSRNPTQTEAELAVFAAHKDIQLRMIIEVEAFFASYTRPHLRCRSGFTPRFPRPPARRKAFQSIAG